MYQFFTIAASIIRTFLNAPGQLKEGRERKRFGKMDQDIPNEDTVINTNKVIKSGVENIGFIGIIALSSGVIAIILQMLFPKILHLQT